MEIKYLLVVLGILLTTGAQNLGNKLQDIVLKPPIHLSLSQCGGSKIWRIPSLHLPFNPTQVMQLMTSNTESQRRWILVNLAPNITHRQCISNSIDFLSYHKSLFFFFKFNFIFICLFLAGLGLRCCVRAFSSCGERGLLFVVVRGLLIAVASLVAEHGL